MRSLKAYFGVLIALAGCQAQQTADPDLSHYPRGLEAREAPTLAKLVDEGKLPPLEMRLPENPLVARHDYDGYEGAGVYGGTWHHIHAAADLGIWKNVGGYTALIRWNRECNGLESGLAESWEYNEDGTILTLRLRKGLKWSDGHPYTSEDFAFYYELCLDERHQYNPPVWCLVDGTPMTVETPDAHTIVMRFAGPNWLVPLWLATNVANSCDIYNIPKHYMIQFHPDYNPEYKDFDEFERRWNKTHLNPERPSLWPWCLARIEGAGYRVVLERNPYYYVVDDLGRQLPYIDRVVTQLVPDHQVRLLKILAGEVDCQFRLPKSRDLSLYLKGQKKGGYTVRRWTDGSGGDPSVVLNWSAPDPVLRELIREQRFRKALAFAIDRDKCNAIAWQGLLQPQAATISEESWHFDDEEGRVLFEEWKRTYSEYNRELADRLLDDIGLDERDGEQYRIRPDGRRLSIVMDVPAANEHQEQNDVSLIIAENWRALGIEVLINAQQGAERYLSMRLGRHTVSLTHEAEMDLFTYPDWVFPTSPRSWHPKVGEWYKWGGQRGEPPTGPLKGLLDIYDAMKKEKDIQKRHEYVRQAVRIHIDQGPFVIGTVARRPALVIVTDHFHNVPQKGILGTWAVVQPATSYPEQYYIQYGESK